MGKSSLLVQTRYRLQQESFKCTAIDMTRIGSENITPLQWYKGIVTELWRGFNLLGKFNLKTWWRDEEEISFIQRLSNFIEDVLLVQFPEDNLVIFIDEIDSILSLDFSTDDFFAFIRFCYNQRAINPAYNRIAFAIFGVATPSDLIADKKRTPFNIGTAIELEGFKLEESRPLAKGLEEKIDNSEAVLREILAWTGGQPFLTQKLCQLTLKLVVEKGSKQGFAIPLETEKSWVETLAKTRIIHKWEFQDEPEHLKTIRDRIQSHPERAGRLLGIYQQILQSLEVAADDSREQIELILSGLVVKDGGILKVKNRIYREVFNLEWVEQQLGSLRPYSQTFDAWIASGQKDESRLLRGQALKDAQSWVLGKSLSDLDYQFLAASVELDRKEVQNALEVERTKEVEAKLQEEQKNARLQRLLLGVVSVAFAISSSICIFAIWQYRQARISEIIALTSSSKGLFASNNQLEAMLDAIKAKRPMDSLGRVDEKTARRVETALTQAVYGTNEFNRLIGHKGSVLTVDISPDGKLIATGSNDKTVKIWKEDGTLLETLEHSATVHRVAFGPGGKFLVSGSLDGRLKLWNVDGKLLRDIPAHDAPVWGVAFSPNGELIASASGDRTVKLWRLDGTLLVTLTGHEQSVWSAAFDAESKIVASAGVDGTVKLWSIDGALLKTLKGHESAVWDVAFCQQTNLLVSASTDKTAKLWRLDGTFVRSLLADEALVGIDCSDNGEYIATSGKDSRVKIWKPDGTFLKTLKEHKAVVRDVALRADGLMAASASDDGTVKLWRRNQYLLRELRGHDDTVWELAVSSNGKLIASASFNAIRLWLPDGKLWQRINISVDRGIFSVAFAPSSQLLAISSNFIVELWNVEDLAKPIRVLSGHQADVVAIAFSPDGQTIATAGDDKTIKLWSLDGKLLHSFIAHNERIWKLAFTPDGQTLASASADRTVKLWTPDGELLTELNQGGAVWGVAINPQGNLIASTSRDDTLNLWTLDGTLVRTIDARSGGLTRAAFSPDGQTIATAGVDNTVKLWNLEGELLRTLPGHKGMVISVTFTSDGKFLVSGGDDSAVILWDLEKINTLNELEYACDWVRDYLRTNPEVEEGDRSLCDKIGN
jgi:YD repeat-containing protein